MTTTTMTTKTAHEKAIAILANHEYCDGTYNIETRETVEFIYGYQVSFCNIGDNYNDDDYEFIVEMFKEVSDDGIVYLGKFDGSAEISFLIRNKAIAIKYAKMFNQISIWDWKNMDTIETGGTGRR